MIADDVSPPLLAGKERPRAIPVADAAEQQEEEGDATMGVTWIFLLEAMEEDRDLIC